MSRYHLGYAKFRVTKWTESIVGAVPRVTTEIRLVNTGKDYRTLSDGKPNPNYNRTTSRCLRVAREAQTFAALPAREQGKSLLQKMGSAIVGRITTIRVEDGVATRQEG